MVRTVIFIALFSCSSLVFAFEAKSDKADSPHTTADHPPHDHPRHDQVKKLDEGLRGGRKKLVK